MRSKRLGIRTRGTWIDLRANIKKLRKRNRSLEIKNKKKEEEKSKEAIVSIRSTKSSNRTQRRREKGTYELTGGPRGGKSFWLETASRGTNYPS